MQAVMTNRTQALRDIFTSSRTGETLRWLGRAATLLGLILYAIVLTIYEAWMGEPGTKFRSWVGQTVRFCVMQARQFVSTQMGDAQLGVSLRWSLDDAQPLVKHSMMIPSDL